MSEVKLRLVDLDESIRDNSERGRVAAGIREGRRRQKLDQAQEALKAAATLAGVKEAHVAEIARLDGRWQREEQKHGSSRFWAGMFTGAMCAAAIAAAGTAVVVNMVIGPTFDAAARSRFDQMAVEAITQERPPTTEEPRSESVEP